MADDNQHSPSAKRARMVICSAVLVIGDDIDDHDVATEIAGMAVPPRVVIRINRANGARGYRTWVDPDLLTTLNLDAQANPRLTLDLTAREICVEGSPVSLSRLEFDLLVYLVERAGRIVTRAELARDVWGFEGTSAATITVHIGQLRRKLEPDPRNPAHLITVRRVGYRFDR